MSTDVPELLQTQISEMRREMNDGFRHISESLGRRLEEHTRRLQAVETRQDTYQAAQAAVHGERLRATDHGWRLWGAVIAVAALAATIVGVVIR